MAPEHVRRLGVCENAKGGLVAGSRALDGVVGWLSPSVCTIPTEAPEADGTLT